MAPKCAFGEGCTRAVLVKADADPAVNRPSKYCDKHTCIGFAGEDPCFKRVTKNGETRRITHVNCKAMFCEKPRLAASNGGWWECCSTHKCKEENCYSLVEYYIIKERYFKYCLKHKCITPDCERAKDGAKKQCRIHTCAKESCSNVVEDEEKLCSLHLQCDSSNCTRKRAFQQGQYQKYCSQHILCEVTACSRGKRDNSRFCINHTCFKRDCTKPTGANFYCIDHTCELTDCNNGIVYYVDNSNIPARSRFCPIHECQKENCHKASRNGKFGYCREHSCDRPDCPNLKLIDPGLNPPLLLCRKHYDESRNPPHRHRRRSLRGSIRILRGSWTL